MSTLSFFHGNQLCQIAPDREGHGFVGLRNGRIIATAPDRAGVARALIKAVDWARATPDRVIGASAI